MKAIFQAVSLQLLSLKHRNSYFSLGIMLFTFLVAIVIMQLKEFVPEIFHDIPKLFNQAFIIGAILIFSTVTESGLLKKWKSLGFDRQEIYNKLMVNAIIVSILLYVIFMFFDLIFYLVRPSVLPYMQYLFHAYIYLTILSSSLFILLFCLFTKKVGSSLAIGYFVLPILFQLMFKILGTILHLDWMVTISPLSIMPELLTNNLFIDKWIIYLALSSQILVFGGLINWRVKKMDL